MRKQQQIWEEEHKTQATLPALEKEKASSFVKAFISSKTTAAGMLGQIERFVQSSLLTSTVIPLKK